MAEENKVEVVRIEHLLVESQHVYKAIVVGNTGAGKTALVKRMLADRFEEHTIVTITPDNADLYYVVGSQRLKLQLWDTCGLEKYRSINSAYYRDAHLALIVFDSSDPSAGDSCIDWVKDVRANASLETSFYLVGTKADLIEAEKIQPTLARVAELCAITKTYLVSAKTGDNVVKLLQEMVKDVALKRRKKKHEWQGIESIYARRGLSARPGCMC